MIKMGLKKLGMAVLAGVLFFLFFKMMLLIQTPGGPELVHGWKVQFNNQIIEVDLPYQRFADQKTALLFSYQLKATGEDALVIPHLSAQAFSVYLNQMLIYSVGDPVEVSGNIKNYAHVIKLPLTETGENLLEIELFSRENIGFSSPPYLTSFSNGLEAVTRMNFFMQYLLLISMGAALISGLILVILSFSDHHGFSGELLFGLASILSVVYCIDYVYVPTWGSIGTALLVKKLSMIAAYLAALTFFGGLEVYFQKRIKLALGFSVPILICIIILAVQVNISSLLLTIPYLNGVLLGLFIAAVILIIIKMEKRLWMMVPVVWLTLSMAQLVLAMNFDRPWLFVMQYVVIISAISFGVNQIFEFNQVFQENRELRKKTNIDPLTGAYNRSIIDAGIIQPQDTLVILDLDNFKTYNDHYGQQVGDSLLIDFVHSMRESLRGGDMVIRYGWDEFMIVLGKIPMEDAYKVMIRIQYEFQRKVNDKKLDFSFGVACVENSVEEAIKKADQRMYQMKFDKQAYLPRGEF
ncbi:MAG: hypothetical protein CVU39_04590 [Chloroflexi bacterium HGW-Chloroflexi-10]|nr:MAG: hypothetical protein CVU39_04590 [Chloroflexi bacterium HGW-Chloroflexi-10]